MSKRRMNETAKIQSRRTAPSRLQPKAAIDKVMVHPQQRNGENATESDLRLQIAESRINERM